MNLPKKIIRLEDGMIFELNKEKNTYTLKLGIPHLDDPKHFHNEYTYETLMDDPRNKGKFKVFDGTENIEDIRKFYWNKIKKYGFDRHGNEEDEQC